MRGRMWSSGHSSDGGSDPKRERCVRADGARKHAARRWTNQGLELAASLIRRETDEYDLVHERTPSSATGSSSSATSSSATTLLPVKREWVNEPKDRELVAVKQEPSGPKISSVAMSTRSRPPLHNGACVRRQSVAARTRSSKT
ncbi:ABC transporter B family member 25 [Hordeum vulgare]|nr:ABC transporter B family member 25 [Hordeum vulgare]